LIISRSRKKKVTDQLTFNKKRVTDPHMKIINRKMIVNIE
jgi:hypothetical protein